MEKIVNFLLNITQKTILSLIFVLFFMCSSSMAVDITGVWDSNWKTMTFWQSNSSVTGEYIYDNGVIIGSIEDNIFIGWWKEYNNAQECGPNNAWSGPALFKFSADGLSFTGDWGYCGTTHADLDPDGSRWVGTRRSEITVYTQAECEDANRFWCNGVCQITECDTVITQSVCEKSGRNWCNGLCQINECDESITQSDCETSGMNWCGDICQIDECNEESECTQEDLNAQYEAGKQYCIDNPEVCGLQTIDDDACADVIIYGKVPSIDCWIEFPTPCEVPSAWETTYEKPEYICGESSGDDRYEEGFQAGVATCDNSTPVANSNCATFDLFTNTLSVPCLNMDKIYWIDMKLVEDHLTISGFGEVE